MQDLEVINRQNAKATEEHVIKSRDAGKWGLAKYTGLNFHSWAEFDNEADRNQAAIDWTNASPGNRVGHHNPTI
jgi:hypothetical protein